MDGMEETTVFGVAEVPESRFKHPAGQRIVDMEREVACKSIVRLVGRDGGRIIWPTARVVERALESVEGGGYAIRAQAVALVPTGVPERHRRHPLGLTPPTTE